MRDGFQKAAGWFFDPSNQLLGIFLGSFLTLLGIYFANKNTLRLAKLQNNYEEEERKRSLRREKMEELFLLVSQWGVVVSSGFYSYQLCMKGDLAYDELLDLFIESADKTEFKLERLELLTLAYAPDIGELVDECKKQRMLKIRPIEERFNDHYESSMRSYSGSELVEQSADYLKETLLFKAHFNHLKKAVAEKIKAEL